MSKNVGPMTETHDAFRVAGYTISAIILLIVFSATSLAGARRSADTPLAPDQQAATLVPTKSPTYVRPPIRSATPVSVSRVESVSSPVSIPGQTAQDEFTVALYHFDSANGSEVPDATGQFTATLHGGAFITPTGLYAGALQLDGNGSYVQVNNLPALSQGTVEAFVDFKSVCKNPFFKSLFSFGNGFGSNQPVALLAHDPTIYLNFEVLTQSGWLTATSGVNPCRYLIGPVQVDIPVYVWPYEAWRYHHVAVTWGPRGTEVWVDGVLHGLGSDKFKPNQWNLNYACEPQLQVTPWPNEPYPLCSTPVLVQTAIPPATPAHAPPGDYFGGLGAFSTLLMGCDDWGYCSPGVLDEVRISNIQRTFSPSVVPTSTPTPTQTPDMVNGAYTPDSHTLHLYHFDEITSGVTPDQGLSSPLMPGYLQPNTAVTHGVANGRFNSGVSLSGSGSRVEFRFLRNPSQGAMEAWVNLSSGGNAVIINGGSEYSSYWSKLRLGVDPSFANSIIFGVIGSDGLWHRANSHVNPSALIGSWHHVAGTWGSQGVQIWIDGQWCGGDAYYGSPQDSMDYFLAGCSPGGNCMQGMIDEVRISDIQRSFALSSTPLSPMRAPLSPSDYQVFVPFVYNTTNGVAPIRCNVGASSPSRIRSIP